MKYQTITIDKRQKSANKRVQIANVL